MAGFESIFSSDLGQMALLFLLIFSVVFAILQKSKILGDGKKQIDALVALSIGLLVTGASYVLDFAQKIIPFFATVMIIILVFLLLIAMFFKGDVEMPNSIKITAGIIIFIVVMIAVMVFTGAWNTVKGFFSGSGDMTSNVILVVIIAAVIAFAYFGGSAPKPKEKEK